MAVADTLAQLEVKVLGVEVDGSPHGRIKLLVRFPDDQTKVLRLPFDAGALGVASSGIDFAASMAGRFVGARGYLVLSCEEVGV